MSPSVKFFIFILVSLVAFVGLLKFVLRRRTSSPSSFRISIIAAIVVVGGMLFAKFGAAGGLPWWIYYTLPALTTLLLPPVAFHMRMNETPLYVVLAFAVSPVIHVLFSFFIGWHEYLPFIHVPSMNEFLS